MWTYNELRYLAVMKFWEILNQKQDVFFRELIKGHDSHSFLVCLGFSGDVDAQGSNTACLVGLEKKQNIFTPLNELKAGTDFP